MYVYIYIYIYNLPSLIITPLINKNLGRNKYVLLSI